MCRHCHDRAGAIAHHHIVGDPHRDLLVVHGVDRESPGEDAGLVFVQIAAVHVGLGGTGFLIGFDRRLLLGSCDFLNEWMLGC